MKGPKNPVELHRSLGLTDEEFQMILDILGRPPTDVELALYAVMWSEHCSYKSSRIFLRRLPTEGPEVLVGPGENAGVIDVGDGLAIALRMESHNHPSFIEPYQGAATGVGGILRDIFTMGARPIALMDPLFIGPIEEPHSRYILDGVVRGIAGYGNSVGVPTVGGQITFRSTYRGNPLVNVFCLGILPKERLVLSHATGIGNLAVLFGARTGRDGIGGVSVLASAGFSEGSTDAAKRPSVQVGDPYEEKRLIEACMELLDRKLVVGIQDLGGAGIACATSETAARGGLGMEVDISAIPQREPDMNAVEIMTSESQERMLAIITPDSLAAFEEVCSRWEINASVIGKVTDIDADGIGRLRIRATAGGELLAEVSAVSLADDAPLYERPMAPPSDLAARQADDPSKLAAPSDCNEEIKEMLIDPSWIFRQYDHQLFLNTVSGPGHSDAAVLLLGPPEFSPTGKAIALSADANPAWCTVDPRIGTEWSVAESVLNVSCAGARPVGLVNCLNFGNPEHETVMWQLSESVDGLAAACRALTVPVVGGNVSLYNESQGQDIEPTPVVAVVGVIADIKVRPPAISWKDGDTIVLLGERSSALAGSRWATTRGGCSGGTLAPVDYDAHDRICQLVRGLVANEIGGNAPGLVGGIHDVSDGGLGLALSEFALKSGVGCDVSGIAGHSELFSEAPSRVLIATTNADQLLAAARDANVPAVVLGAVSGERIVIDGLVDLSLTDAEVASQKIASLVDNAGAV